MVLRRAVVVVLAGVVAAHPLDCGLEEASSGQRQIWVPNCQGAGCNANGLDNECAWYVDDLQLCEASYNVSCEHVVAARKAQHVMSYPVSSDRYDVEGYVCGGSTTLIYHPSGDGPFPLIIYLHGSGGSVDGRESGLASVASSGFVVVAPRTGGYPGSCTSKTEYKDATRAWTASKSGGAALSPGLAKVDWSRTGIWGYSMGAKTTPDASVQEVMGVDAIVCSHGSRDSTNVTVPAMFVTGTRDDSSSPADVMFSQFEAAQSPFKVYSNIQNGTHTRPIEQGSMNPWVAKFFACHLSGRNTDCDAVYGSGLGSLCAANDYAGCTFSQTSII